MNGLDTAGAALACRAPRVAREDERGAVKPPLFRYFAPSSFEEALALRAEHAEDCAVLAGGQSLMPLLNLRMAFPGRSSTSAASASSPASASATAASRSAR